MDVDLEIQKIFDENKVEDLKQFIKQRSCLNFTTQYLTYLFYLLQATGVFLVSIGKSYGNDMLVWIGVGCNSLASFIYIVINSNAKINAGLLSNIRSIKTGTYVDEGVVDGMTERKSTGLPTTPGFKRQATEI